MLNFFLRLFTVSLVWCSINSYGSEVNREAFLSSWGNSCNAATASAPKICVMERHLFLDKSNSRKLLTFGVRTAANESPVMSIILPLGVLLPVGVDVSVGKSSQKLAFLFCDATGCIAQIRLDDSYLDDLSKEKVLSVKYQPVNGKATLINLDISGFADTYQKVKQK